MDARFARSGKIWSIKSLKTAQLRAAFPLERQIRSLGSVGLGASTEQYYHTIRRNEVEIFSLSFAEGWNGMERVRRFIFGA